MTTIVWFREDLRLADNPALDWAVGAGKGQILPVYIHDTSAPMATPTSGARQNGGASNWWLETSLTSLDQSLRDRGGKLYVLRGDPLACLRRVVEATKATCVVWNRIYADPAMTRDADIKSALKAQGLEVKSCLANLIHEPALIKNKSDGQFKVFTPFWKTISVLPIAQPSPAPALSAERFGDHKADLDIGVDALGLSPTNPDWAAGFPDTWTPGEAGAHATIDARLEGIFDSYNDSRNFPDVEGTSRLSPHLRWGEISPRQVWHKTLAALEAQGTTKEAHRNAWAFLREIGWREFSHYLLFHFPELNSKNWRPEFDAFPWENNPGLLGAWQRGQTGYPIVDAGMRQLWATGWMHNRVRMIAASFLIKHLMIDWRAGEAWFWDTLVDACPANNPSGWQWVAGSGADASPYFRIFNPITQAEKFDPSGEYVRRWVPELARLDNNLIHRPWQAPALVLYAADIRLGDTYPNPIVDHSQARQTALEAYETIKKKAA